MSSLLSASRGLRRGSATAAETERNVGADRAPGSSGCGTRAPGLHLQGGSSGRGPGGCRSGAEGGAGPTRNPHPPPHSSPPPPPPGKWPGHGRADPAPGAAIAGGLRQPGGRGPAVESHRLRRPPPRGEHRRSGAHGISPGGQVSSRTRPSKTCPRRLRY